MFSVCDQVEVIGELHIPGYLLQDVDAEALTALLNVSTSWCAVTATHRHTNICPKWWGHHNSYRFQCLRGECVKCECNCAVVTAHLLVLKLELWQCRVTINTAEGQKELVQSVYASICVNVYMCICVRVFPLVPENSGVLSRCCWALNRAGLCRTTNPHD